MELVRVSKLSIKLRLLVTEIDNYNSATNESASKIVESQIFEIKNSRYLIVCNIHKKWCSWCSTNWQKIRLKHDCSRPAFDAMNSHSTLIMCLLHL